MRERAGKPRSRCPLRIAEKARCAHTARARSKLYAFERGENDNIIYIHTHQRETETLRVKETERDYCEPTVGGNGSGVVGIILIVPEAVRIGFHHYCRTAAVKS